MLKLSVGRKECLFIGDNVKIVLTDISDRIAHVMIDAPREVAIVRGKAAENTMSDTSYRRMKNGVAQAVKEELGEKFSYPDGPMRLTEWIREEELKYAAFGIYGRGNHARECYNAIFTGGTQRVLAYVNPQRSPNDRNIRAGKLEDLKKPGIDYIIIAMQKPDSYREALRELIQLGIDEQKIVWMPSL